MYTILTAIILTISITGCASQQSMQASISSMVSQSAGVPQKDHYEYRGPYQFALRTAQ